MIHTVTLGVSGRHPQLTGVGLVVQVSQSRSKRGPVLLERQEVYRGTAGTAELLALNGAMRLGLQNGWTQLRLRIKNNSLRRCLSKEKKDGDESSNVARRQILELADSFEQLDFPYINPRKAWRPRLLARDALQAVGNASASKPLLTLPWAGHTLDLIWERQGPATLAPAGPRKRRRETLGHLQEEIWWMETDECCLDGEYDEYDDEIPF